VSGILENVDNGIPNTYKMVRAASAYMFMASLGNTDLEVKGR